MTTDSRESKATTVVSLYLDKTYRFTISNNVHTRACAVVGIIWCPVTVT